jgi:diguanylate cyclase (GGDEF)-like protein/PAS domain S-box-containing protein
MDLTPDQQAVATSWPSPEVARLYQEHSPTLLGGSTALLLALGVLLAYLLRLNRRLRSALNSAARLEQDLRQTTGTLEARVAERTADLSLRGEVLDRISRGVALQDIFKDFSRQVEQRHSGVQCCIVLQESAGGYVAYGVGRPPPDCYLKLAQSVDTAGASSPVATRVIIPDVLHLPWWRPYRSITRKTGLRSLWIEPILDHRARVAGCLLLLHRQPQKTPRGSESAQLEDYARLAALAIDHHRTEQELRIAATAFETQDGILVTDATHVIVRANRAACEITGYPEAELLGRSALLFRCDRHDAAFYQAIDAALAGDGYWRGEIWHRRKNGEVYPQWQTITAVAGGDGGVTHHVTSFSDITAHKQAEEQIRLLAFYDPLTRLPNRRLLIDRLEQALISSVRSRRHGALMFLDLDNFKVLNDTQSHHMGDLLLVEVGRRLQQCVRAKDTVARLGGDEFLVMMEDLDENAAHAAVHAEAVAEKIRNTLAQPYFLNAGSDADGPHTVEHQCTSSIGITLFHDQEGRSDDYLKRADLAMYQAKAAGRNAIRFFDPAMQENLARRTALADDLRKAIALDQLHLLFQLQVDGESRPTGVEALIRWSHPERGTIAPKDFMPLAEETGQVASLGLWVLGAACRRLASWALLPETRGLSLAVNLSSRQFRQPDFVGGLRRLLAETGVDPSRLTLELTEALILEDVDDAITKMGLLKALGVRFAMDDFGTGYSSLSYLQRLPIDQIKIDGSCIRELPDNIGSAGIVRTIIGLCGNLGIPVVAEGVETAAQYRFLRDKGCRYFQGYLFGQPLEEAQLLERLARGALSD